VINSQTLPPPFLVRVCEKPPDVVYLRGLEKFDHANYLTTQLPKIPLLFKNARKVFSTAICIIKLSRLQQIKDLRTHLTRLSDTFGLS